MMRSIAESIEPSFAGSDMCAELALLCQRGFEPGDRLVGKPDAVVFAVMKHLHDDFEQLVVSRKSVRNGAGLAQIVGRDGVGVAHRLHVHDSQAALDQHFRSPRYERIKRSLRQCSSTRNFYRETK